MKVQVEANEITNTNVQLVSMVKRGANRIPFRITKEDTTMLDLHAIGRQLYKAEPSSPTTPTVVGVFLAKGVEAQPIIDALMKYIGTEEGKTTFKNIYAIDGIVPATNKDYDSLRSVIKAANVVVGQLVK